MNLGNILGTLLSVFNNVEQSKSSKKKMEYKKEVDKNNAALKKIELNNEKYQNEITEKLAATMLLPYLELDINKSRNYVTGETPNIKGKYPQFFSETPLKNYNL